MFLSLLLLLLPSVTLVVSTRDPVLVLENTSIFHETLKHGEDRQYVLRDLIPGDLYEFKVSYPASQPYTFTITFSESLTEELPQRKLLDIDKEEFTPTTDTLYVRITAHDYKRSVKRSPHVSFSVYFERVYHGIPAQAYKLIAWLCLVIPCSAVVALWVFRHWYDVKHEHVS